MKKLFILFVLFIVTSNTFAQQAADEKQIQAAVIKFFDGVATLDDTMIKANATNDFTLVEHGLIWNADSLINALKPMKSMNIKRTNKFDFTKTEQKGDMAWVIYYNTADMVMGERKRTVKWLESALLQKQAGVWKIKLLHSTDLK